MLPHRSNPAGGLRILVTGLIIRRPVGGLAWHYMQYVLGLARLGHDVYYIEDSGDYSECFDPEKQNRRHGETDDINALQFRDMDSDPTYGLAFAAHALGSLGLGDRWAYYDSHTHQWRGPCRARMPEICRTADVLLNLSHSTWLRPWLREIPVRVLVDTDPVFSQLRYIHVPGWLHQAAQHTAFFTFGENYGRSGCSIPIDGLPWRPTRQPTVLDAWPLTPGPGDGKFTTVMSWNSYDAGRDGRVRYGVKSDAFPPFLDLPAQAGPIFELAINRGETLWAMLRAHGWCLRDALDVTRDPWSYQRFIAASKAEFAVAKHAYVVTRSGWFSERSAAYLACGRPVVTQETGFSDGMETGRGVLAFSTPEEALAALDDVNANYAAHCKAAREVAETYFDADTVLPALIDDATAAEPFDPDSLVGRAGLRAYDNLLDFVSETLQIPGGLILVDDNAWAHPLGTISGRPCLPFIEKNGLFWGRPADDQQAVDELERMRRDGAVFIVFAPPAFWWLDYYSGFARHLRTTYRTLHESESLIVFDLSNAGYSAPHA